MCKEANSKLHFLNLYIRSVFVLLVLLLASTEVFGKETFGTLVLTDIADWKKSKDVLQMDKRRICKLQQCFNQVFADVQTLLDLNNKVDSKEEKRTTMRDLNLRVDEAFSLMKRLSHLKLSVKKGNDVFPISEIRSQLHKVRYEYFDRDGNLWPKLNSRQQLNLFRSGRMNQLRGIDIKPEQVSPNDGKTAE